MAWGQENRQQNDHYLLTTSFYTETVVLDKLLFRLGIHSISSLTLELQKKTKKKPKAWKPDWH